MRRHATLTLFIGVWLGLVALGARSLLHFSNTPGLGNHPLADWPQTAPVLAARDRHSLLVFSHPQCPCTRATIGELARIAACCGTKVKVTIFVLQPTAPVDGWTDVDLRREAQTIPGVSVVADPEGAIARQFGARTSGQTMLYNSHGRLEFAGGITAFRGHSGDNDGRDAIEVILTGGVPGHRRTPTLGCALYSETLTNQ